jgi:PIN domain nuclease of toxin-antitoxin system
VICRNGEPVIECSTAWAFDAPRAGSSGWPHRDPFDRIIVATALARGDLPVVSKDATLDGNGAAGWRRIW